MTLVDGKDEEEEEKDDDDYKDGWHEHYFLTC